jgi:hypothetical protein
MIIGDKRQTNRKYRIFQVVLVLDSLPIDSVTCQSDANCDCETVEDNLITDTNRGAVQVRL